MMGSDPNKQVKQGSGSGLPYLVYCQALHSLQLTKYSKTPYLKYTRQPQSRAQEDHSADEGRTSSPSTCPLSHPTVRSQSKQG